MVCSLFHLVYIHKKWKTDINRNLKKEKNLRSLGKNLDTLQANYENFNVEEANIYIKPNLGDHFTTYWFSLNNSETVKTVTLPFCNIW